MMEANPLDPTEPLQRPPPHVVSDEAHPPQPLFPEDSAVTKAEKLERNGPGTDALNDYAEPPAKRVRLEASLDGSVAPSARQKGVAPIKSE